MGSMWNVIVYWWHITRIHSEITVHHISLDIMHTIIGVGMRVCAARVASPSCSTVLVRVQKEVPLVQVGRVPTHTVLTHTLIYSLIYMDSLGHSPYSIHSIHSGPPAHSNTPVCILLIVGYHDSRVLNFS